jgi:hypothetical protein
MSRYLSGWIVLVALTLVGCVEREGNEAPFPELDPEVERDVIERLTTTEDGVKIRGSMIRLDCSDGEPTIKSPDDTTFEVHRPNAQGRTTLTRISCEQATFTYEAPILFFFCAVPGSPPSRP